MADGGAMRREPLLLGTIAAVVGVVLALVIFGGFGGGSPVATSGAGSQAAGSIAPTGTLTAIESPGLSPAPTAPPVTEAPTAPPTTALPTTAPSPTPNTNPAIVSFEVPTQEDCTNSTAGSVTLRWEVRNASGVTISIDGSGIFDSYAGLTREEILPFGCSKTVLQHTYTITTIGGSGPAATMTKTIRTRAPSIVSFSMGPNLVAHCPTESGVVGISLAYEIRAATGVELYRGEQLYSTYNGKVVETTGIMYQCDEPSQAFTLLTTGGFGEAASKQITVERRIP